MVSDADCAPRRTPPTNRAGQCSLFTIGKAVQHRPLVDRLGCGVGSNSLVGGWKPLATGAGEDVRQRVIPATVEISGRAPTCAVVIKVRTVVAVLMNLVGPLQFLAEIRMPHDCTPAVLRMVARVSPGSVGQASISRAKSGSGGVSWLCSVPDFVPPCTEIALLDIVGAVCSTPLPPNTSNFRIAKDLCENHFSYHLSR
jgi:hypothetical protein